MKHKKLKIALVASLAVVLLLAATLTVFAYFTTQVYVYTEDGREVAHVGMNLQLLFGKLSGVTTDDLGIPSYCVVSSTTGEPVVDGNGVWYSTVAAATAAVPPDTATNETYYLQYRDGATLKTPYNSKAPWGSAQNPYVISESRHLQNLSALQSVGYFDLLYLGNNFDANGNYIPGSASIPYFLICTDSAKYAEDGQTVIAGSGTPITISGDQLEAIKPIGSAEHPFIGVIGGAFAAGETTVAGKTSSVSAINGFKIQTNTNQTDVGLFGYVGYLGVEPSDATAGTKFFGVASSIQNILLSDVQVVVKNPTIAEIASSLLGHVFNNHRFSYTGAKDSSGNQIPTSVPPHENHHIGIFAGHISYAQAEYISVYYSSEDKCAIDLLHATSSRTENYHSSTGIVGFMHNMNSTVTNQVTSAKPSGHCQISYGGITSSGVSVTPDTPGAGGGDEIGIGRGYVVAKTLYEGYHYISGNQGLYDRIWKYTVGEGDSKTVYYGPMFYEQANGSFVTQNGEAVTIDANGVATYTAGGTAKSFKIYSKRTAASATTYTYTLYDGTTSVVSFSPDATNNVELPQSVWQYVLQKPVDESGTPIEDQGQWTWNEAVLIVEKSTDSYILKETRYAKNAAGNLVPVVNEYPVALGAGTATITGATYSDGKTGVTISNVILSRTVDNETKYFVYNTATTSWVEPEFFREKPLQLVNATTSLGTALCIQSESSSNSKYFYDGVFTFALSDPADTIESTWENETPDQIVIGPNSNDSWTETRRDGFYGLVAYIKPIKSVGDLELAATSGKKIFIGSQSSSTTTTSLNMIMLPETNVDLTVSNMLGDDFFTAESTTKDFYTTAESNAAFQALNDYVSGVQDASVDFAYPDNLNAANSQALAQSLYRDRNNLKILNLGLSTNTQELIADHAITVSVTGTGEDATFQFSQGNVELAVLRSEALTNIDWVVNLIGQKYHYSLYSGDDVPNNFSDKVFGVNVTYTFTRNTWADVDINTTTGAATIKYVHTDGTERYVNYSNEKFNGTDGTSDTTTVYFYTIEAMSILESGQAVFAPISGKQEFNADQYVLWPNAVMDQNGTYFNDEWNSTTNSFSTTYVSATHNTNASTTGYHNAKDTVTDGSTSVTRDGVTTKDLYRSYTLLSLSQLYASDNGWQDGYGTQLSNSNLRKKFTMERAIDFSLSLNIPWFGIGNLQTNSNSVMAPVGQGGASSNVPKGSVAFRINETTETGSNIYVIVSVPVSKVFDSTTNTESLHTAADYYLGLWKTQDIDADSLSYNSFSQTTAVQKFELPRSRPYNPESATAANSDYILVEYGGTTYRCYLNGDRVLVAYRFTVMEAGTYVLGTAIGQSSIGNAYSYSYPMEIVYCAADGTASEGLDGTIGSVTGALDYVYDYGGKIINVQDYAASVTVPANDYNYYYNSRIITYTDNGNTAINDMMLYPYRYVSNNKIYLKLKVQSGSSQFFFTSKRAGVDPDEVVSSTGTRPTS